MSKNSRPVAAIDLFCGAGGLSYGLQQAGVSVVAGIDIDESCRFPFERNVDAPFLALDVSHLTADHLERLWPKSAIRMLAGCAPCQPFSPYRRGADTSHEKQWPLLDEFARLVLATAPEIVTMENVPRIGSSEVFANFVDVLRSAGYSVAWRSCDCVKFGLPQSRRRLVLLASRLGAIEPPASPTDLFAHSTVRSAIGGLPVLSAGQTDPHDPLHKSRSMSELNLRRIRASIPGGTWHDWPEELRAPCHRKLSGSTFRNVYARMEWDKPSPTITTLAHNFGTGRFGHPEQDRPISLREAAMLQGFPRDYSFVPADGPVHFTTLGRLIGNAVPPPIGRAIGEVVRLHTSEHTVNRKRKG